MDTTSDMARPTRIAKLWDADHSKDGQKLICKDERYQDLLISNASALSKSLKPTDNLWTLLLHRGVIDEQTKVKIQVKKTEQAQVFSLVNQLTDLEVYKLHGFIWAIVNSHQHHIAELLGFDVRHYFDMEIFMKYSNFRCPACSEFYTKAYIMTSCGHYICGPCVKGAQFICKNGGMEDITCPVPECNKITEASSSEGSIGLDEDIPFRDLCQVLVNEMTEACSGCKGLISASPVKHYCTDCDQVLCADCTNKHKKAERSHKVLHCHLMDKCCLHGRSTETFCERCDIYCCDQCIKRSCGHDVVDTKKGGGSPQHIAEILKKHVLKLNDDISCFINQRKTLGQHEAGVKEYIKAEEHKITQIANDWAKENLVQYSGLQEQVGKRLNQSLQWQKSALELSAHLITRPWLLDVGENMEIILKENAEIISSEDMKLATQLGSGRPIPRVMTPIPLIMRPPDNNKDGTGAEMTCSYTVENISQLEYKQYSPPFIIRNLAWKIFVASTYANEKDKSLGFYLSVQSKPGSALSCNAVVQYRLLNWIPDREPFTKGGEFLFFTNYDVLGHDSFISWNELMDPENGYVKDDYIRLEVHITADEPKVVGRIAFR